MAIYTDKAQVELKMTKQLVAKLSMDNGAPSDNVVEDCCMTGDALVLSKIAQFYKGPHPIVAPTGLAILRHAATLYAVSFLYMRDSTFVKAYGDATKSTQYRQAECIMNELQTDSRCLYDNDNQPFIGAGVVSPSPGSIDCAPQLFGRDYHGDLLCQPQEF